MILENKWIFGGEVVKKKDFGDGYGGNITIRGASKTGPVELSVFLTEAMFQDICDKDYPKVVASGHVEMRTHETKTGNLKHSLKHMAEELTVIA